MTNNPNGFVTNKTLDEAVETIVEGVGKAIENLVTKQDLTNGLAGVESRLSKRLDKVESEIVFIKHDIRDIKEDLSDTPSLKQFNVLKNKVDILSNN